MRKSALITTLVALSGCGGLAWNTTVADSPAVRQHMAASVITGNTTEMDLITRWGRPTQKIRQGGQVEYIYRNIVDPDPQVPIQFGDSTRYVIVTFQYGVAVGVRTNEDETCRATFPPRPPGAAYDNPSEVQPILTCPGLYRPGAGGPLGAVPGMGVTGDPIMSHDPESDGKLDT